MKPRSAKAKGRRFTQEVAVQIAEALGLHEDDVRAVPTGVTGPDLWLSPAAIDRFPFAVEAKCQESLNVWAALEQAQGHAEGTSLMPLLLFRRNRSEPFAVLRFEDFLKLAGSAD